MFEVICGLITLFIVGAALYAYLVTRDPLHPAIFMAPLFCYFYGVWPIILNREGKLAVLINENYLQQAAFIFLLSIVALYFGLLHGISLVRRLTRNRSTFSAVGMTAGKAQKLYWVALFLGGLSLTSYIISIENVGGLYAAYSRQKGGGYIASGWFSEATLLAFPSLLMLALSVFARDRRVTLSDIVTAFIIASPHLIQGTLGGRRGPLFLILTTLLFSWFVARGRIPSLKVIIIAIGVIGSGIILASSQRSTLYLGSGGEFEVSRVFDADGLAAETIDPGNSYVAAVAMIVASDYFGDYFWGYRYFVTFFIRPIPREIWPSKYQDMNATWLNDFGDDVVNSRYAHALGFKLPGGVAGGTIADGYIEFYYGVVPMFFVLGLVFAAVYRRHKLDSGFATVLYYIMLALSIYLPTQSFSAWLVRLIYMAVIGYLFWWFVVGRPQFKGRAMPHVNQ